MFSGDPTTLVGVRCIISPENSVKDFCVSVANYFNQLECFPLTLHLVSYIYKLFGVFYHFKKLEFFQATVYLTLVPCVLNFISTVLFED